MPINFHDEKNRLTYAKREADTSWMATIKEIVDVTGKKVLDIGCGGGIYSKALVEMGADQVTGVDFSGEILQGARENCQGYTQIDFAQGDATEAGLPGSAYDIVLERALIHHVERSKLGACCREAYRLLKPQGMYIIQDRTPDDCLLPGSTMNIRGYFFECYPQLIDNEIRRRRENTEVMQGLLDAGFEEIEERKLWETNAIYPDISALLASVQERTGRSILHELTDDELNTLMKYLHEKLRVREHEKIVEEDRWTIWTGIKNT